MTAPVRYSSLQYYTIGGNESRRGGEGRFEMATHILRREHGQGNNNFPCSADHEQDWQPYSVDPYSCYMCHHTYIEAEPSAHGSFSNGNGKEYDRKKEKGIGRCAFGRDDCRTTKPV